jgi:arylformamidase
MKISRGLLGAAVLAGATLVAANGVWAQQAGRLPRECVTPKLRMCLLTGGALRQECIVGALTEMSDPCRKLLSARGAAKAGPLPAGWHEEAYGSDPLQKVEWTLPAKSGGKAPLLFFIHGGAWSIGDKRMDAADKGAHFSAEGWAFASTNYRLVPQAKVEDQAADIAAAIALLRKQPGVDPARIVIMGHSAGAHLAALVGSDPTYLQKAGVPLSVIRGVVLLDGAGYDVPAQMTDARNRAQAMYQQAFGTDLKRQRALSPVFQAAAPNAGSWLILPVERRQDSLAQSEKLAAALRAAGSTVSVVPQAGKTHMTLNRELGEAGDASTAVIDAFLAKLR